ncbi:nucleotidyl transferase AbiEii/AbiGii toxin family protein [Flavobacterium notoginsengisoli]|uniref:nucleotidyl transferase AbiEii/AbiGii toxin family protein n=1 Tax=Flavobacterium notoginsengisoli TaxID=1478199 RepID=UPI00362C5E11
MSYPISSNKFDNPLLKELLQELTLYFDSIGTQFYIIGATARDIIFSAIHDQEPGRKTFDLDIAIAIPNWDDFEKIAAALCNLENFTKSPKQKQRFHYKGIYELDIVPFGEIAKEDQNIYWPPEEDHAMSVKGFSEVAKNTITLNVDEEFTVQVASLPGIFILKLIAWKDRHYKTSKDADDISFILDTYLGINEDNLEEKNYDIYEDDNYDTYNAGATLIGRDLKKLFTGQPDIKNEALAIIERELETAEQSILISQIMKSNIILNYDQIYRALLSIVTELKKE